VPTREGDAKYSREGNAGFLIGFFQPRATKATTRKCGENPVASGRTARGGSDDEPMLDGFLLNAWKFFGSANAT
jgi:hypothetical protein